MTPPDPCDPAGMRIPDFNKGFYYYKGGDLEEDRDNYGLLSSVQTIEEVACKWGQDVARLIKPELNETAGNPGFGRQGYLGQRFGVGDMSMPGGRYFRLALPPESHDHQSHRNGVDVDVRYVRMPECGEGRLFVNYPTTGKKIETYTKSDGTTGKREYIVNALETSDCYDLDATKALFAQFAASGKVERIVVDGKGDSGIIPFGSSGGEIPFVVDEKEYKMKVVPDPWHFDHFHMRFKSTYGPAGEVKFNPSSLELPVLTFPSKATPKEKQAIKEANAVTITTSIIRDANGFALFEGYPIYVSVRDANNNPRGYLVGNRKHHSYWTNDEGRLTLRYASSGSEGDAFLQLWVDKDRKIPLGKPLPIHFTTAK